MLSIKSLKSQIILFVLITFVLSWSLEFYMIHHGGIENIAMDFLLMWTPGIVGLILSLLFSKNVKDIGFKFGRLKFYGLAYAIPALTAILILFSLILLGQGQFEVSPKLVESKGSVGKAVAVILLIGPTLSVLIGFVSALGEEIGWRGFLHSRMMALKIPHPFLITGIIWSIWHWPLILFSNYATSSIPLLSLFLFSCVIISFAIIIGWLREASGSVLVAGLAHSVHNAWMQAIYPAFLKKGPLDEFLGGESGVLNAVIYIFIAIYVYRRFLVRGRETTGNVLLPVDPSLNG